MKIWRLPHLLQLDRVIACPRNAHRAPMNVSICHVTANQTKRELNPQNGLDEFHARDVAELAARYPLSHRKKASDCARTRCGGLARFGGAGFIAADFKLVLARLTSGAWVLLCTARINRPASPRDMSPVKVLRVRCGMTALLKLECVLPLSLTLSSVAADVRRLKLLSRRKNQSLVTSAATVQGFKARSFRSENSLPVEREETPPRQAKFRRASIRCPGSSAATARRACRRCRAATRLHAR